MADVLQQLTSGLSDRYSIERELGPGGMATVYLARDVRLSPGGLRIDPEFATLKGNPQYDRLLAPR